MKVFFYVQHLLGIGHLKRAAILARALAAAGFEVTLASGGVAVDNIVPDGVRLVQLPAAAAEDASFKHLVDATGRRVDQAWMEGRKRFLLESYFSVSPDILLVELYPFGRRQMRFELAPLLEAAASSAHRPLVVCSVRDLVQSKPRREDETLALARDSFDRILVHGDPRLIGFERSFAPAAQLEGKLHYTGYVVDHLRGQSDAGSGEVIVSAGGGSVGRKLLETAIRARPLTRLRSRTWRVITGVNGPRLEHFGEKGLVIERTRNDFTTLLANCELSISQAGYNTVMETLQAKARAVLVPFAGEGESEQTLRARVLAEKGFVEVLEEAGLEPATLAAASERAASRERPAAGGVDLDGARRSAELLRGWVHG